MLHGMIINAHSVVYRDTFVIPDNRYYYNCVAKVLAVVSFLSFFSFFSSHLCGCIDTVNTKI